MKSRRARGTQEETRKRGSHRSFAAGHGSRVLAKLAPLAQKGELVRRLFFRLLAGTRKGWTVLNIGRQYMYLYPSVWKDYGVALWLEVLEQCLVYRASRVSARTVCVCGWKDQFGNDSPFRTVSRCDQFAGLSRCFQALFVQPVQKVSLQTEKGLADCLSPSSTFWSQRTGFPICWYVNAQDLQVPLTDIFIT